MGESRQVVKLIGHVYTARGIPYAFHANNLLAVDADLKCHFAPPSLVVDRRIGPARVEHVEAIHVGDAGETNDGERPDKIVLARTVIPNHLQDLLLTDRIVRLLVIPNARLNQLIEVPAFVIDLFHHLFIDTDVHPCSLAAFAAVLL